MGKKIEVSSLFAVLTDRILLDVRTPAEFSAGHIPAARNLPLFSNEERAEVGATYKQRSPHAALLQGLDYVGPKMRAFIEEAEKIAPGRKVIVHCWRGGRRSESMSWLLNLAGFDVQTLNGGYKAYRNYILSRFGRPFPKLIVLGGFTGSGKTEVLHALATRGEQVIDLEGLANHKGSSFGALGEDQQPTVEQFENNLFAVFNSLDAGRNIWVEDESRSVGRVFIPEGFWQQMQVAPLVILDIPLEERIRQLVSMYATFPIHDLMDAFSRIKKRLGGQHVQTALRALQLGDFSKAADIALRYYDKAYRYDLDRKPRANRWRLPADKIDAPAIAGQLIQLVNETDIWKPTN